MKLIRVVLAASIVGIPLVSPRAQQPNAQPSFETASIRPSTLAPACGSMLPPGGTHYAVTCFPLRSLIALAWNLNTSDIQGGDPHTLDAYYDVSATTSADMLWNRETVRPMLRKLLTERFELVAHTGTKQTSGYGMVIAKGGPKLKQVSVDSVNHGQKAGEPARDFFYAGHMHVSGLNADDIATSLTLLAHEPVVDHTNLTGLFSFDLNYAPDNSTDSNLPSFFTAVEEQLGLKLQPEKVTVNTLVIDHVDAEPTEN